jgi:polysaccharide biosynthesis protein PslG
VQVFVRRRWLGTGFVALVLAAIVAQGLGALPSADATTTRPAGPEKLAVQSAAASTHNILATAKGAAAISLASIKVPIRRTSATTPEPIVPPLADGSLRIGMSYGDNLPGMTPTTLNQTLDDAVSLGIGWLRIDLAWDDIQPGGPTDFQWSNFDRIVAAASARSLTVLPILDYTPAWARRRGCGSDKCAPADDKQFAAFASAAARRYSARGVHTWEIWNEPNVVAFWQPAPSPSDYALLVRTTAAAIRSVDRTATLISGGLASTATSNGDISQLDFLAAFCAQGGAQLVDAIGYHPYSYPVPPGYNAPWNAWAKTATTQRSFKSILASWGAPAKKVWLTEYGAPTKGPGVGATSSDYKLSQSPDHVDEALQATMAADSVQLAAASSTIGGLFWYSYQDLGTATTTTENFFGLRRFNGTPKPAWTALKDAIARARAAGA